MGQHAGGWRLRPSTVAFIHSEFDMNIKRLVSLISAAGMLSLAFAGAASARSVDAATGSARVGSQANCFNSSFITGAVDSTCSADFLIPLQLDTAGAKAINFTSRATAAGASCRAVANNRFGTGFNASPFVAIPVSAVYVAQVTTAVNTVGAGVFFADCITNSGTSLLEFDYP
jgi:hypothetical protein